MIFGNTSFSLEEMFLMLYRPLEEDCPVRLRKLKDEQIEQIPFLRQVMHLLTLLSGGELKLTANGYIPPKIVEELYLMGEELEYGLV